MLASPRSSPEPASTSSLTRSSSPKAHRVRSRATAHAKSAGSNFSANSGGTMEPVRTCLGCRSRADKSSLLRVVAANGAVTPDPSATLPGRGAWVHPTTQCVEKAI
ncbi:MAG: YlxR family protein, partial [Glaciihabitans sp.]